MEKRRVLLISSFNPANFAALLTKENDAPRVEVDSAPFGNVIASIADRNAPHWQDNPFATVVWTQASEVIESFGRFLAFENVPIDKLLGEVDAYCAALLQIPSPCVIVPTWVESPSHQGWGLADMTPGLGRSNVLMQMNLRLAANLAEKRHFYVVNAERWVSMSGVRAFSPSHWFLSKIPYSVAVFQHAALEIKNILKGLLGNHRKLVVVDLDNTLWGGVVGDIGWESLALGGHDAVGEAFVRFQQSLKALKNKGVLLAIVSRNEEPTALQAIDRHPEMILRRDDFSAWRINWEDKARNLCEIAESLNLGLQSAVFIDDDPGQRERVREALPEVLVPDWPSSPLLYSSKLEELNCFPPPLLTEEDRSRATMYATEQERQALKAKLPSVSEWIESLNISVTIESTTTENIPRIAQLLNKTNQMNLSTRRMTESELTEWKSQSNRRMWAFRVSDKFGDYGLTGILSVELRDHVAHVVDFILSCRVMGRTVENAMLHEAVSFAREANAKKVVAVYRETEKNRPCLRFLETSGFNSSDGRTFSWETDAAYPAPNAIAFTTASEG